MDQEKTLAKQHQSEPQSLQIKEQLSSMILQRRTNTTISIGNKTVDLLNQYSPAQITGKFPTGLQVVVMGACPTIDCCARIESPMLGTLAMAYPVFCDDRGKEIDIAISWMKGQFTEVSTFANVKEKMTDWQMECLCQQILADYPTLTMFEFILFCARLRSGIYEDFYGSIDPMRILKSLRMFIEDKRKDYIRAEEEQRKKREERETKEIRKNAVSWGQYCEKHNIKDRPTPFVQAVRKKSPKQQREKSEDILQTAKWIIEDSKKAYGSQLINIFKKKYNCTPEEYIASTNANKNNLKIK